MCLFKRMEKMFAYIKHLKGKHENKKKARRALDIYYY